LYDLIIFDCDGVLVDSEPIANRIMARHLLALGLEMSLEQVIAEYVGLSMKSVVEKIEHRLGTPLPDGWLDTLQQETFAAFKRELKPVEGIGAVLEGLQAANQRFCVASSGAHEKIRLTLTLTGLYPLFEGRIFSASDVARGKPAPDLFLKAAADCGAAPAACAVVEDSRPGIEAARAAGMTAYAYAVRGQACELEKAGARILSNMSELLSLL
jgi:HAD superfamily hydrolase (TIGR01509 family)